MDIFTGIMQVRNTFFLPRRNNSDARSLSRILNINGSGEIFLIEKYPVFVMPYVEIPTKRVE